MTGRPPSGDRLSRRARDGRRPALVLVSLVLVGCSSAGSPAAEPAEAPALTATPSGLTAPVGARPEGLLYDADTQRLVVAVQGPDRLQILDPTSLRVQRSVPLPAAVRHLQPAAPGSVLVPCQDADRLLRVRLPGGAVTADTKVQSHPHDATWVGEEAVVGNEFGHSLTVVRGDRVVQTIGGSEQPGGLAPAGRLVAVVDVASFTVALFDPASGRRVAVASAGTGPTHVAALGNGRLAVVDTRGDRLIEFSASTLRRVGSIRLPGTPYGIAVDRTTDLAWITLTASNEVVGIDLSGLAPHVVARYPTVRQPNSVAVAPGSRVVWVAGTAAGQVQRIVR